MKQTNQKATTNQNAKEHLRKTRDANIKWDQAKFTPINRREKIETENIFRTLYSDLNSYSNSNYSPKLPLFNEMMDRDYFHWGATAQIMEIIRRRRKSPETL